MRPGELLIALITLGCTIIVTVGAVKLYHRGEIEITYESWLSEQILPWEPTY